MIKKFNEFVNNDFDFIDAKLTEIRDLVNGSEGESELIYEWINKENHELSISITFNDDIIKYEFKIDDLSVVKVTNDTVNFEEIVDSIDGGLDLIEKDIMSILNISESRKSNHIKSVNELFDSPDMKMSLEIPYLKGELKPLKWSKIKGYSKADKLVIRLMNECEYIGELNYASEESPFKLVIGKKDEDYSFMITITENNELYNLDVSAKLYVESYKVYKENYTKNRLNFRDLVSEIRKPVFDVLVRFNEFLEENINTKLINIPKGKNFRLN